MYALIKMSVFVHLSKRGSVFVFNKFSISLASQDLLNSLLNSNAIVLLPWKELMCFYLFLFGKKNEE